MEEQAKQEESSVSEWIILAGCILVAFAMTGSIYYFFIYSNSVGPEEVNNLAMKYLPLISFVALYLCVCMALHRSDESIFSSMLIALIPSSLIAMALWSVTLRIIELPSDDQRYECRVSGGNLENFGERGWVCIKPVKGE